MRITLGVTGGVAAYKAAELARRLQQEGFSVQVVMTRSAREFITPLTFAALTGQKVITELFAADSGGPANLDSAIEHIAVAQRTDLLLVAPATAETLAKFARGLADDFLSTLYLAATAPVVVAPAMNVNMWQHVATHENVEMLRARGVRIVEPGEGYLACGMTGAGRLAEIEEILAAVREALQLKRDLEGETVLVTAGPTCEDLDPVRYLTNRSSGKMGYAVAKAAARRGARVILVSGPVALAVPEGVERVSVRTAEEMHRVVLEKFPACTAAEDEARQGAADDCARTDAGHPRGCGAAEGRAGAGGLRGGNRTPGGKRAEEAGGQERRPHRGQRRERAGRGLRPGHEYCDALRPRRARERAAADEQVRSRAAHPRRSAAAARHSAPGAGGAALLGLKRSCPGASTKHSAKS
jgi:3-polyprenyl-4-hydroxybenzoate decarboxylase